jgi:excisionase family DNA binding protein
MQTETDSNNPIPTMLTTQEVKSILRVNRTTLYGWIRSGAIPATRMPDGAYRFHSDQLSEWIESRKLSLTINITTPQESMMTRKSTSQTPTLEVKLSRPQRACVSNVLRALHGTLKSKESIYTHPDTQMVSPTFLEMQKILETSIFELGQLNDIKLRVRSALSNLITERLTTVTRLQDKTLNDPDGSISDRMWLRGEIENRILSPSVEALEWITDVCSPTQLPRS